MVRSATGSPLISDRSGTVVLPEKPRRVRLDLRLADEHQRRLDRGVAYRLARRRVDESHHGGEGGSEDGRSAISRQEKALRCGRPTPSDAHPGARGTTPTGLTDPRTPGIRARAGMPRTDPEVWTVHSGVDTSEPP
jgi:hypothetical protein